MPESSRVIGTVEQPTCVVCGAEGIVLHSGLVDVNFGAPGTWSLRRCNNASCGTVWLDPKPLASEIWKAYQDYYTHGGTDVTTADFEAGMLEPLWRLTGLTWRRDRLKAMYLPLTEPARLLDVGCGNGQRLEMFQAHGWEVEGQDVDADALMEATRRGLTVHLGELADVGLPPDSFDVVTMNHVIEHVHDPRSLLRECLRVLKPGGRFVLVTPNVSSLGYRFYRTHWRGLEVPRHIQIFSAGSLSVLASEAGFGEIRITTDPSHAQVVARSSSATRGRRKPIMHETFSRIDRLVGVAFQLAASAICALVPTTGEELVLIARRPS